MHSMFAAGIKIDDNVPLPERDQGGGLVDTMRKLKPGQSFVYPAKKRASIAPTAKRLQTKVVTSSDKRYAPRGMVRVWKVE